MVKKNKKGWVKVVEAFFSILIIMGVVFLMINKTYSKSDVSEQVSEMEKSIIKNVQLNESLRAEILYADVPSNWSDFDSSGLLNVKDMIENEMLSSIDCEAKICFLEDKCFQDLNINKDVYAESVVIASDLNTYNPRQFKIFCWVK